MKKNFSLTFIFLLVCFICYGAKVDTIAVQSTLMGKKVKAVVVLPSSYSSGQNSFRVLYLLHGYTDDHSAWVTKTPDKSLVSTMADKYNMIIVCPNGDVSFYIDSPIRKDMNYESFITKDLLKYVDENYKTIKSREGRVISGLSMGGHGALYLAARHPQLYIGAGSIAGVTDLSTLKSEEINKLFESLLGTGAEYSKRIKENSIHYMTSQLKSGELNLIIDCGTDDFLFEMNQALHKKLLDEKIPHDYIERPGQHNWEYFANSLEYHMIFFQKVFSKNSK